MALELPGEKKRSTAPWLFSLVLLAMLAAVLVFSYRTDIRLGDVLGNMARKNDLISQMRADLLRSVEAEKSATLADSDEESRKFVKQSLDAAALVEASRSNLGQIVEADRSGEENKLLGEFDKCWNVFQQIDKELLDFAVRNTNLKAAALSFGKGKEAVQRIERSLASLIEREAATPDDQQISKLAYAALSGVLDLYSLEAPHIITSKDERMDEIEAEMNKAADRVRAALGSVEGIVKDDGRTLFDEARAAFDDFLKVNAEIVMLSRQNTNVKSMELSLGAKRKITVQCQETLNALQNVVRSRGASGRPE